MRNTLLTFSLFAIIAVAGCNTTPKAAERAQPTGVPANAELIGGGWAEELEFDRDGRLIVVDTLTNAAIATFQVRADEPVELDAEIVAGSMFMARHGAQGIAMIQKVMEGGGESVDIADMPSESMTVELYFIRAEE